MVVRVLGNGVLAVERFEETEPPDPLSGLISLPLPAELSDLAGLAWGRLGEAPPSGAWLGEVGTDGSGALLVRAWPASPAPLWSSTLAAPSRSQPWCQWLCDALTGGRRRALLASLLALPYYAASWSLVL